LKGRSILADFGCKWEMKLGVNGCNLFLLLQAMQELSGCSVNTE